MTESNIQWCKLLHFFLNFAILNRKYGIISMINVIPNWMWQNKKRLAFWTNK